MKEIICTNITIAVFGALLLLAVALIGLRHIEHVKNTQLICDKIGIKYEIKTNFVGIATRIFVEERK